MNLNIVYFKKDFSLLLTLIILLIKEMLLVISIDIYKVIFIV
jgi:hypothetical protein